MWKRVKSGVQGRVARFRVPGGAEPVEAASDERPMPIAASILWKPIEGAAEQDAGLFPVFITQRVLAAVHDHCAATPAACFGLLIGDVVDSPETGASHVVVESTIRLPASPDDDAKTVLVQGWVVAQDVLRKSGDLLVGWYRGGGGEAALSPAEADAHRAFFVQPWQLAVVVGSATRPWARYCVAPAVAAGRKSACRSMSWSIRPRSDPTGASPRGCAGTTTAPKRRRSCRPPPFPFPRSPRRPVPPRRSDARRRRCNRGSFCPISSMVPMRAVGAGRPPRGSGASHGGPRTLRWPSWPPPCWSDSTRP